MKPKMAKGAFERIIAYHALNKSLYKKINPYRYMLENEAPIFEPTAFRFQINV